MRQDSVPKHSQLYRFITTGITDFSEYDDSIPIEEWSYLWFQKNFDFDYYEDWSQLIEDKAIAPYLSEWKTVYNEDLLGFFPGKASTSRRLILDCLAAEEINVRKICETDV